MNRFKNLTRYPTAIAGITLILLLVAMSIYAIVSIPYAEAVDKWRGGEEHWYDHPKTAFPAWLNWFRKEKLPDTIKLNSLDENVERTVRVINEGMTEINYSFTFDFDADEFPTELIMFFDTTYREKLPYVSITWLTPDGREIRIGDFSLEGDSSYRINYDDKLKRRLKNDFPQKGLFAVDPAAENLEILKGTYTMNISTLVFEDDANVETELIVYGRVFGLAGTDHKRRDLTIALLWGAPIALSFGLLAAVGTSIITLFISAIGTWYGGWVDQLIQRITEVNLILPVLPILIMVGTFYSRSLWLMLGVIILLNIFGGQIKTYRAIFMQERESPYIEAAKAYGASDSRIIFRYLIPRIIPLLIPGLVVLIPSFVFLESALSVLGLGDPSLPTWGKMISDARLEGALYNSQYYWVLEPSFLLMLTGFAFAMLGYSLDRIFNPRLREL